LLQQRERNAITSGSVRVAYVTDLWQLSKTLTNGVAQGASTNAVNDLEAFATTEEQRVDPFLNDSKCLLNPGAADVERGTGEWGASGATKGTWVLLCMLQHA
jgi:hypothetical protein